MKPILIAASLDSAKSYTSAGAREESVHPASVAADPLGSQVAAAQKTLGPAMTTEIVGAPDGTVRALLTNPVVAAGSFYALAFGPNGGDGKDYQQAKPFTVN
jgi:hypothetical protein